METYVIIDSLGARHATLKAKSCIDALNTYKDGMPSNIEYFVIAVEISDIPLFVKNVNKLSN